LLFLIPRITSFFKERAIMSPNHSLNLSRKKKGFGIILIFIVIVLLGWWLLTIGLTAVTPKINHIPLVPDGSKMLIRGEHFGSQTGRVSLLTSPPVFLNVVNWSDSEITTQLPQNIKSGTIIVECNSWTGIRTSLSRDFIVQSPGLPSQPYGYKVPVQADSPWPTFRRDQRNSGSSPITAEYQNDKPWVFQTGKGIFNTPVIDNRGIIYVGSADHFFYAINPDGSLNWKFETGEIIDSAAAIGPFEPTKGYAPITFISGDGSMYHFSTMDGIKNAADRLLWKYEAELRPGISFNRWFEGNVAVGPDGTLYAGNTNFNYYAIHPDGSLKWVYSTTSNNWSQAAFDSDGSIFWGSVDTFIRGVSPSGNELWKDRTLGFVAASAAVGSDNTVYIGSFDSQFYALDPSSGQVRWTYPTNDHIYSSAALGEDTAGGTNAIYFASADGNIYALRPNGSLIWRFDTGDVVRSSPVIGRAKDGQYILYVGAGNGNLYAINASNGILRWSYNTTPSDPELADRNDLNGSPALGKTGIYIGGEHGQLVYVPYDYCLNVNSDPHCTIVSPIKQPDGLSLSFVTSGGNTVPAFPDEIDPASLITLKLILRQNNQTQNAFVCNSPVGCSGDALQINLDPPIPFDIQHSADGKYIYIRPLSFLSPGTTYHLNVSGKYYTGGFRFGNMTLGGNETGHFSQQFTFKASQPAISSFPLKKGDQQNTAFEWTRLAAPLPPMMPSLNQIGFDYMEWIIAPVEMTPPDANGNGKLILWAIGAQKDSQKGLLVDPKTDFILPLSGTYQADSFIVTNQNFTMPITGIPIPFNLFELRGKLSPDLVVKPGAVAYGDTDALSIPSFGPYLVVAGLPNNWYQKMLVTGTFVTRPYQPDGNANKRPVGIHLDKVQYIPSQNNQDSKIMATFKLDENSSYPINSHIASILLTDADKQTAINLDYRAHLTNQGDEGGNLRSVTLNLPGSVKLPDHVKVYIILDVFPIDQQLLVK
jgi:outer membrane protein assembly factor BamB